MLTVAASFLLKFDQVSGSMCVGGAGGVHSRTSMPSQRQQRSSTLELEAGDNHGVGQGLQVSIFVSRSLSFPIWEMGIITHLLQRSSEY